MVTFTPLEYHLLKVFVKNPHIVLTRQVLLEKLWDKDGNFVDEHALTSAMAFYFVPSYFMCDAVDCDNGRYSILVL